MRANEFIVEEAQGKIHPEHGKVLSNLRTYPDQNMYHGSGYLHSKFLKALAGAGAGNTPDASMGDQPWDGGDPVYSPYHPVEEEMLDRAAKHVGSHGRDWGDKRSLEPDGVNKTSPVVDRGPIQRKQK